MRTSEEMNKRASKTDSHQEGIFLMLKAIYWKLDEMQDDWKKQNGGRKKR